MRDRLTVFARAAGSHLAYPAVLAVLMLGALFLSALASGHTVPEALDGFYRGLYMLLAFSMQVVLMLVLSTVLSGLSC